MRNYESMLRPKPIYVLIDESGNFDFSSKGSKHFVVSAFITPDPIECGHGMSRLTYEFLARGLSDQIPFHASENSQGTRLRVTESLCPTGHVCSIHSIYVEKHRVMTEMHDPLTFYSLIGGSMGKYLVEEFSNEETNVVLLFDVLLPARQRSGFLKTIKHELNKLQTRYTISFRPVKFDVNGQIADYYCWSVFRSLELGDPSWLEKLPGNHTILNLQDGACAPVKNDHPA